MKRSVIIIGISLMLMVSGNGLITAQRGMQGMMDTTRMGMKRGMPGMQMHGMRQNADSAQMCEAMKGMGQMHMRQMGPGMMMLESIPNVTGKQKKEIADLRVKQQDEMQKLREESAAKMKTMREIHMENMMNILTDEQKKFLEAKTVKAETPPAKTK